MVTTGLSGAGEYRKMKGKGDFLFVRTNNQFEVFTIHHVTTRMEVNNSHKKEIGIYSDSQAVSKITFRPRASSVIY